MNFVQELIRVIKEDYDIPKYKCEVVIDTVLSIFGVQDIVKQILFQQEEKEIKLVAKEFPIKQEGSNRSSNIDYLLIDEVNETLYFVELKTTKTIDQNQMRSYQKVMRKIGEAGSADFLIDEFQKIKQASEKKMKYEQYQSNYLEEFIERRVFQNINKAELIYISPESVSIVGTYNQHSVKHITFNDLYQLEFIEVEVNEYWNEIKKIFKFIQEKK